MADENNAMMEGQGAENKADKKAEKKAAKQEKKAQKAMAQEEKRRKKLEQAGATPEEIQRAMEYGAEYEEEGGSRLAVFFVTFIHYRDLACNPCITDQNGCRRLWFNSFTAIAKRCTICKPYTAGNRRCRDRQHRK